MSSLDCVEYEMWDPTEPDYRPLQCPICKGFLKWDPEKITCKKCGTELLVIPFEVNGEDQGYGKVCPISERKR